MQEKMIPIRIAKAMTDVMANFDFERASELLKVALGDSYAKESHDPTALKDLVEHEMWRIYEKATEENLESMYTDTAYFRIEYQDGDFRVALQLVSWDTSY